jgi:two-component system phosphate regulon sensor histidine kinase PhoR
MRKDFFANVSHELRTPLTVIKGYLETLLDSSTPNTATERALQQMSQQAKRMDALVNDLLLLNRLETDKAPPKAPVAINTLLAQIVQDAKVLSGEKHHTITLDQNEAVQVLGDSNELHSAISNLIFNAVKYTPPHKNIYVRSYKNDEGLHISIQDEGIGVEPQHIPRLTERFYRADNSRNSETGGTGLGLAIVKHVLVRHDASLDIRSQLGKGSTFTCHFPIKRLA